jgi:hypothetical protein
MAFWIVWGIDALIAAILVVFFFIGIADGSVSSFNIVLWMAILGTLTGVLWGGYALRGIGRSAIAVALLAALAIPGVLVGLFFLLIIVTNPKWN